jgi:UDP-N-acetylmuramate dehydrogenase
VNASIREHVPLAPFTTFGIGGLARYFIRADSETLIPQAVEFANDRKLPLLVLGGGSNLLVADEGFPGVVLRVEITGTEWFEEANNIRLIAGAGVEWDQIVAHSVQRQLFGFVCLSGIPGTVGGTPVQNVGAYGQEVSETVVQVDAYDRIAGRYVELDHGECRFSYRTSLFNSTARERYIITRVHFRLSKQGTPVLHYADLARELKNVSEPTLATIREAVRGIRARKAMLIQPGDPDSRSAGSFFKNPIVSEEVFQQIQNEGGEVPPRYAAPNGQVKTAAAWLIERSGIAKGFSIGSAGVSSKHTLALVNKGGATAADILRLAREVRARVNDRFGVRLAVEPVFVGFDIATTDEFRGGTDGS